MSDTTGPDDDMILDPSDTPDARYIAQLAEAVELPPGQERTAALDALHETYVSLQRGGTTRTGLPYPSPTDPIAEGADAIRALAQALDREPATIRITPWGDLWKFDYPSWFPGAIRRERNRVFMQGLGSNRKTVAIGATGEYTVATIPPEHAPRQAARFPTMLGRGFVAAIQVAPDGKITLFTHDDIDHIDPGFCTFYLDGMSWPAKN